MIFCNLFQIKIQFLFKTPPNASVNGHLELPLLKVRQRFDAVSTSNLEVHIYRDWWILTHFIFCYGESSPYHIWGLVNLERTRFLSEWKRVEHKNRSCRKGVVSSPKRVKLSFRRPDHVGRWTPHAIKLSCSCRLTAHWYKLRYGNIINK